ncbi:hypothetical protein U1701_18045 [Sphingomonas sp. PB2P19]|uniref:hypothetical protein n=1 Tax=Sphingomonas rhamnosi TaxID=3096156 RepID=UPI002FC5C2B2
MPFDESNGCKIMHYPGSPWPEGLNDEEALQRLQTLCLGACDGIQDLSDDARYKALRRTLLGRTDLRPVAPAFLAAQPNLEAFVRHVRETKDRTRRREMVREQFKPLWDEIREAAAISSASWTGRPSLREQGAVVRALAPVALEAVQRLIDDEVRSRDNGGPVDADRAVALEQLKSLHRALGELITSAEASWPLDPVLDRMRSIGRDAKVALGKATAALPITTSALIAFGSVVGIVEFFVGNVVVAVAAGGIAGNTLKDAMLKKDPAVPVTG